MSKRNFIGAGVFIVGCMLIGNALHINSQLYDPIITSSCDVMYEEEFTECLKTYQRIEVVENITVLWAPECAESFSYSIPIVECFHFKELDPRTSEMVKYMKAGFFMAFMGGLFAFAPIGKKKEA